MDTGTVKRGIRGPRGGVLFQISWNLSHESEIPLQGPKGWSLRSEIADSYESESRFCPGIKSSLSLQFWPNFAF